MNTELLKSISEIFTLKNEIFVTFEHGWFSPDSGEWFILLVRGCLWPDQLDRLRELVYVSSICVRNCCIEITCNVEKL